MINDVKKIESPLGIRATRQTFSSRLVPVSRCVAQHRLRNFSLALYRLYILECGCSTLQYTLCTPTPLRIRAHGRIARATMTCYDRAVVRNETIKEKLLNGINWTEEMSVSIFGRLASKYRPTSRKKAASYRPSFVELVLDVSKIRGICEPVVLVSCASWRSGRMHRVYAGCRSICDSTTNILTNISTDSELNKSYLVHLEGLVSKGSSYLREIMVKSRWAATIFCNREMIS